MQVLRFHQYNETWLSLVNQIQWLNGEKLSIETCIQSWITIESDTKNKSSNNKNQYSSNLKKKKSRHLFKHPYNSSNREGTGKHSPSNLI
jgi:hypothetical protein